MTQANDTNEMNDMNDMDETNEIAFHEPVRKSSGRSAAVRVGIVAGSALLVIVGAVAAMGASPAPAVGADPTAPAATAAPGVMKPGGAVPGWGGPMMGGGMHGGDFGDFGRMGFRDITISGITGSDIALKTDDGWTRTITVTSATKITKGGATIAVGDLASGDQVRFSEEKATDGSYTITAIVVVLPTVGGEVTAIDGQTLTVTQPGGTTTPVHLDANTTYQVDGAAGKLSDIKVGSYIVAEGTQRTDGSLDATDVHAGTGGRGGFRGMPGFPGDHGPAADPNASPAPSTSAG
jgi:hypothetical protein